MFGRGKKDGEEKLSGPQAVPELVKKYLVSEKKKEPALLYDLKAVVRPNSKGENSFDIRIFSEIDASVKEIAVKDYTTLDEHAALIVYEGWFDKKSKQVELQEKKELKPLPKVPISTEAQIREKIEALSEPNSSVFFYMAGSPVFGGPLGRGAAIVELNPPGSSKKYTIYYANVDGLEPVSKRQKAFDSNKPRDIASFVANGHHEPYNY